MLLFSENNITFVFQEYTKSLGARAVAYVNVDYALDGLLVCLLV